MRNEGSRPRSKSPLPKRGQSRTRVRAKVPEKEPVSPRGIHPAMVVGAVLLALLLAGSALYFGLIKPNMEWQPQVVERVYERDGTNDNLPKSAVPDSSVIFSEEEVRRLNEGHGTRLTLKVRKDPMSGGSDSADTVEIRPSRAKDNPVPSQRRVQVQQMIAEAMPRIERWKGHRPGFKHRDVIIDVTGGISDQMRDSVNSVFREEIGMMLRLGDTVQFCGMRISSSDLLSNSNCMVLVQGEDWEAEMNSVTSRLLASPTQGEMRGTSLYIGLANFLNTTRRVVERKILVVSDAVENKPDMTTSFYRDEVAVMDSTRWNDTWSKINQGIEANGLKFPTLSNTQVIWWVPPGSLGTPRFLRSSALFARFVLTKHGAVMERPQY